jgi:hypothetical protein
VARAFERLMQRESVPRNLFAALCTAADSMAGSFPDAPKPVVKDSDPVLLAVQRCYLRCLAEASRLSLAYKDYHRQCLEYMVGDDSWFVSEYRQAVGAGKEEGITPEIQGQVEALCREFQEKLPMFKKVFDAQFKGMGKVQPPAKMRRVREDLLVPA